jgi:hypothetical protein
LHCTLLAQSRQTSISQIGKSDRDLVQTICRHVTIDWTVKESVKANLRRLVKCLLRKYGYLPEKQEKAMVTVLGITVPKRNNCTLRLKALPSKHLSHSFSQHP